jgi:hypothetical protein
LAGAHRLFGVGEKVLDKIRPQIVAGIVVVLLTACHGSGSSVPNSFRIADMSGAQKGAGGKPVQRMLYANVRAGDRTPDDAYQIRTMHAPGVSLLRLSSYVTANGTFTQADYKTAAGPVQLVQSNVRSLSTPNPAATREPLPNGAIVTPIVAQGVTSSGGTWVVSQDFKPNTYEVVLQFPDSTLSAEVPSSTPISVIQTLIGSVY